MISRLAAFAAACCGLVAPVAAADRDPIAFEAGFARTEVTPDGPLRLSGYSNRAVPSEGIDSPLFVRAMALRPEGGETFALVSLDTIGTPAEFTDAVASRLKERFGIDRPRFVLAGTHSHATPHLAGGLANLFTTPLNDAERQAAEIYTARVADAIVETVGKAISDLQPARLAVGAGQVGFAVNRRMLKDGRWTGFGVNPEGPVDRTVSVLRIESPDGGLRGVVFDYACHATTLTGSYNRINADWPGYAARDLEDRHPGLVALPTIGCGADANPEPRGERAHAEAHGRQLALEVGRVLKEKLTPVSAAPVASFGFAGLPFDRPSVEQLKARLASGDPQTRRSAERLLDIHARMGRLPETYPAPVQAWRFGDDLTMVFLGGEVVVDYATRLKKEIAPGFVWVTAYANDVFGYVASERVRREGGYEVDSSMIYYGRPGPWAEGTEEVLIRRIHEILKAPGGEPALSPTDAKTSFRLQAGLSIACVASEPLIADPVGFAFGTDGRLWVVEMGDYPGGREGPGSGGRVKALTDADRDGVFDAATVFLDGLSYPNGVMPWRDGVLVSAAPDILFARDTDGDGKADTREVFFTGFPEANPQHRVNGFAFGTDGLVYVAHGADGIRCPKTGATHDLAGRDFAFDPDTLDVLPMSGDSQFGRCRTADGDWFGNENSRPLFQYVLEDHCLRRNPYVAAPNPKAPVIDGEAMRVRPASRTADRFNDLWAADRFTSACGPTVYQGGHAGYQGGQAGLDGFYVCEPVHNLVRRTTATRRGVVWQADAAGPPAVEFLASTDPWCRPVRAATGPDGGLWVADMYRLVIEHPQWIPEAWQARLELRAGSDKGRIWRIAPADSPPGPLPNLAALPTAELIGRLDDPNGTVRDLTRQELTWRADRTVIPALRKIAGRGAGPGGGHALGVLAKLDALDEPTLLAALADGNPAQRDAVRSSEPLLGRFPRVGVRVCKLARGDGPVRLQAALALGEWDDPRAAAALAELAAPAGDDRWLRAAVLSSAVPHAGRMLAAVAADSEAAESLGGDLVATILGTDPAGGPRVVLDAIRAGPVDPLPRWKIAALAAVAEKAGPGERDAVRTHPAAQRVVAAARASLSAADEADEGRRADAIRLLAGPLGTAADRPRLTELLGPRHPPAVQRAVLDALAASGADDVPDLLLAGWPSYPPRLRAEVSQTLLGRPEWSAALLAAVEDGRVAAGDLDATARGRMLNDGRLRDRATAAFGTAPSSDRAEVVGRYAAAADLAGDAARGRRTFAKSCAACHKLGGAGNDFGPDLAALQDKSGPALLTAVLDPNRAVEAKYRGYAAVTADGQVLTGMIVAESSTAVTLARPDGRRIDLLRKDLSELRGGQTSFMPEGLERDLSPQDLADLFAFVRRPDG